MLDLDLRKQERKNSGLPDFLHKRTYNLIIGLCILYGFVLNALIVWALGPFFQRVNYFVLIIGYVICCIIGVVITRSNKPIMSFLGYNLVVIPIGAVVSVILPAFYITDILLAIIATGAVVLLMTVLSSVYPLLFAKLGRVLFFSLLISLVVQFVTLIFGYAGNIFNWIFVVIFSLYIGYDWYKAQVYPKTLDNAIDSALDLYLDIINLFLRLLQIFASSRNRRTN